MRLRFTLTHRGSELGPFVVPALSAWDTQTGPDAEWTTGVNPSVTVVGGGPFSPAESEYLYVDFGFEAGSEYTITIDYTKTYVTGSANPRSINLHILDNDFNIIFSASDSTPPSPGGSDTVSIAFTATEECTKIGLKVRDGSEVTFVVNEATGESFNPDDVTLYQEINEPDGWKDAVLRLQRDKDFRSLIEFFDGSFIFYGRNGVVDGGIHFIKALEQEFGPDVTIEMLIELAPDDITYEEIFGGQLDLSLAEEMMDNKMRIPIIRDNLWAKFNNRRDTPVDLFAVSDLDLNAIATPIESVEILLPSQIITYYTEYTEPYSITYDALVDNHCIMNWSEPVQSDINLFTLVRTTGALENLRILGLFEAPWDGDYQIQMKFFHSNYDSGDDEWSTAHAGILQFYRTTNTSGNADDAVSLNSEDVAAGFIDEGSSGDDRWFIFTPDITFRMYKGEQMAIIFKQVSANPTIFGETKVTWKVDCDLATTGNAITLSGEQSIDGSMTATSRVLVKDQNNKAENGIYETSAGAWTRTNDANTAEELIGIGVHVSGGANQSDSSWIQTRETIGTLGSDPIEFEITDNTDERFRPFPVYDQDGGVENWIKITAKTRFPSTQQPGVLIHDAGAAILKSYGLGNNNPFYSEVMGADVTNARQYEANGCIWNHAVIRGLQLRGYTLEEKPFFTSFNEWWKGVNPIFNLGLSYDTIGGGEVDPEDVTVAPIEDWADAGGPFPGAWNEFTYNLPIITVNGSGGADDSGYTCGAMVAVAGETYPFTFVLEAFDAAATFEVTCAILDSGYNPIVTEVFNYTTTGFKVESFNLTPPSNGDYFAIKVENHTPIDSKTFAVRLGVGTSVTQLLLNEDFDTSATWTNEDAGSDWTVGSGVATVTINTFSKKLTQEFVGGEVGEYRFISEIRTTNVGGGEGVDVTVNFYDEDDNLLDTDTQSFSSSSQIPWSVVFTPVVPVAKIEINAEVTAGTDITVVIPYSGLFITVPAVTEEIPEEDVIRVEEVEYFYDPDPSLLISNIRNISRKYDNSKIYNKINVGYVTWKSEEISGIDDPQTQHIYSTRFEKIGETITIWSEFIAASLAIERTRRERITESKDFKFDDSVFIIALKEDDISPDTYSPELDEKFSTIENLLDSDSRYNVRLTPARMLLRWRKWLNGCLQNYTNSFYKFVRGEGNFDMESTMDVAGCFGEDNDFISLSEKQDIEVTTEYIHLSNYYEMEVPMDWEDYKIIRNNRRKAIGISMTDIDHVPLFIDTLDYEVMHGRCKISGWVTEYFDIAVIADQATIPDCFSIEVAEGCEDALTDEESDILVDENGVCLVS